MSCSIQFVTDKLCQLSHFITIKTICRVCKWVGVELDSKECLGNLVGTEAGSREDVPHPESALLADVSTRVDTRASGPVGSACTTSRDTAAGRRIEKIWHSGWWSTGPGLSLFLATFCFAVKRDEVARLDELSD